MEHIIKKMMENHRLDEMSTTRADAILKCISLGKQFIEHFHKVYVGGLKDKDFEHHCHEMQTWYNDINSIKLKSNNKSLTKVNKIDWFFTAGASTEDLLPEGNELDMYENLIIRLLATNNKIVDLMRELLEGN